MNLSEIFIRRPVMTSLVMFGILMFGYIGFRTLPINALPNVDFPTLVVTASLPGASPETMAASVATPLERQFTTIAGLTSMSSSSALGTTQITLQFDLMRNLDAAALDVQACITTASSLLPTNMPSPPSFQKVNPAQQPVLYLALSSNTLPLSDVDEYAETYVAEHLSMVSGVAQVSVLGQQKYAVRAQLDPRALVSRGIGLDQVAGAIAAANVLKPTGNLYGAKLAYQVQSNDQLLRARFYRGVIVTYHNGAPVRLRDIGEVIDSVQNDKVAGWVNRKRGVILAVQRQPGTNTVRVCADIRNALPDIVAKIPASCAVEVLYDLSDSIKASVYDVEYTLLFTVVLVVGVIWVFLRNFSATVIASIALPMSIVGTFALMSVLGFSLNNLTLMALTLATGFVVDDAIVVLENIVRHMERGESFTQAAFSGAKEIGFTVVSMTLSLVAVFIPVLLTGGIIGRLFREFSVTVSVAILVSGFVSLSVTPMLCSRFLKPRRGEPRGLYRLSERLFTAWLDLYDVTLCWVLRHRLAALIVCILLAAWTGYLYVVVPKGFLPSEDNGQLVGYTEGPQTISFYDMVSHQQQLARIIGNDPDVASYVSSVGSGGAMPTGNEGAIMIYLKPHNQRRSADDVMERLRRKVRDVIGINIFLQNPPTINIGGQVTKSQYQFSLQAPETSAINRYAPLVEQKMRRLPALRDVTSDLENDSPQIMVMVDRDKASMLGVTMDQIDTMLGDAYAAQQISTIYAPANEYWVIVEVAPAFYRNPNLLSLLYVRSGSGTLVPLNTIARFIKESTPLLVNHLGQLPSATISFNLRPGVALGDVLPEIEKIGKDTLPRNVSAHFQGTALAFQGAFTGMLALLALAVLVIYIVLGILYESYIHPITILTGLPSAGLGALLTLLFFHVDLNVYSFLGLIMLIGIVKKNAIMMVDFALQEEREHHRGAEDSIHAACLVRFRPIMMTTMAALMGSLPIALGLGAGAEARQPLGLAVVGGLLVSQSLTLYITPVVYTYFDALLRWCRRLRANSRVATQPPI